MLPVRITTVDWDLPGKLAQINRKAKSNRRQLGKGVACERCRSMKKRCSLERPCKSCCQSNRPCSEPLNSARVVDTQRQEDLCEPIAVSFATSSIHPHPPSLFHGAVASPKLADTQPSFTPLLFDNLGNKTLASNVTTSIEGLPDLQSSWQQQPLNTTSFQQPFMLNHTGAAANQWRSAAPTPLSHLTSDLRFQQLCSAFGISSLPPAPLSVAD
mmetsp:Transcript_1377/g.2981  ORF Transcript_1377/g.2981 Transcript_1377/m.2981 type:complete len:214 (-) Transcript_1377:136-777(-)